MNNERHNTREVPRDFPWKLIEDITNDFARERKIGSGGYGVVYKGVQPNGQEVAVKKLHNMPGLDEDQFQNELRILTGICHRNVVQLVGKSYIEQDRCVEHKGRLVFATKIDRVICLEFLPEGSLEKHLSDEQSGLRWHSRYKIIKGICDGLKYLHGERIFHLDLKPSNILLDKDMVPKIADFGLSRLFSGTRQSHTTKNLLCTLGYAPPEFVDKGKITKKFDVFSLGVIIIKVLAGPDGYSTYSDMPDSQDFIDLVQGNWRQMLLEAGWKDALYLDAHCNQVKNCTEIALKCVESNSHKRPSIEDIISMLNETEETIDKLYQKLFVVEPSHLYFLFEPDKLIPCPVHLTNNADHDIAYKIEPNTPDIFVGLLDGFVRARSTQTYILTMQKQQKPPPNLDTIIHILSVVTNWDLGPNPIDSFDEAEVVHDERKVVKITSDCECASQIASKPRIEVLSPNPTYSKINVHPLEPWVLMTSGKAEGIKIWNYKTRTSLANDTSSESNVTTPPNPIRDASNPSGLLAIAEETFTEFLSKATGTAIDWVQMPGMMSGPDTVGSVAISHGCRGVAACACGLVNLESTKVIEILKDRPSWFPDCRRLEVFTMFPVGNGGTIELIYMQMYAPTTLVPARDFLTLRYTTTMEDGSLVVCETSLSDSGGGPSAASAHQFVRAEMLPSGYLVRPCEGGGSIVHIVDHLDLEAWRVHEVLRPLYESSRVVAHKMTTVALRHLRQIAQETSGVVCALGRQPAVLRTFSQRLSRWFNDAISGFNDDGWSVMRGDGSEDVVVACNSTKKIRNMFTKKRKIRNNSNAGITFGAPGGIICAKASMLLQSVPPAVLVRFLRNHRSEWADYNIDAYLASSLKTSACSLPGLRPMRFSGEQMIMPLCHTVENEEILEVVRHEWQPLTHDEALLSRVIHLLQLSTGIDEKSVGSSFQQLVFAPIDEHLPDDAPLISSGFRVISLDMKTDGVSSGRTLDSACSLDVGSAAPQASRDASPDDCNLRSVLTIAFQFPYEMDLQDSVATMAREYVRSVVFAVQRVSMAGQRMLSGFPEAATLARLVCQSYHYHLGVELLNQSDEAGEALSKMLWHHPDAVLCCSFKEKPMFTFANKAGLDMLETSLIALQDLRLDKIFDESGMKAIFSDISKLMEQGYAYLPSGVCMSGMGRLVSFDQAVAWKVLGEDSNVHCLAFCFISWSLV